MSSIARRDPFGFERQPTLSLRKTPPNGVKTEHFTNEVLQSGMFLTPLNSGDPIPLLKTQFVIGRSPECDLQVQDVSVSSRHCELRFDGYEWTIKDLKSRNGIRINGELVRKQILQRGDTIVIGSSLRLRFGDKRSLMAKHPRKGVWNVLLAVVGIALAVGLVAGGVLYWGGWL
jgi:hypothetical protein